MVVSFGLRYKKDVIKKRRMKREAIFLLLLLRRSGLAANVSSGFTCNPWEACPDDGMVSGAGGKVFVTVVSSRQVNGIEKKDDEFVRVRVGNGPHWKRAEGDLGERLSFGWHASGGARIVIELRDRDTGWERFLLKGRHDVLGRTSLRLPFCSVWSAPEVDECPDEDVCRNDDTDWKMGKSRHVCNEEGWLQMSPNKAKAYDGQVTQCSAPGCLYVKIEIIPFEYSIDRKSGDQQYSDNQDLRLFRAVSPSYSQRNFLSSYAISTSIHAGSTHLKNRSLNIAALDGEMLIPTFREDSYSFRLALNRQATLTVCRNASCTLPNDWYTVSIDSTPSNKYDSSDYTCDSIRIATPTRKNEYGIVLSDSIEINVNTDHCYPFFFTLIPDLQADKQSNTEKETLFDLGFLFIQLGVLTLLFFIPACHFMRHHPVFDTLRLTKSLLETTNSFAIECIKPERRALYYLVRILQFFVLLVPSILFWSASIAAAVSLRPATVGWAICFLGTAGFLAWLAFMQWRRRNWRLTQRVVTTFLWSLVAIFIGSIGLALIGNDFCALTMGFAVTSLVPFAITAVEFNGRLRQAKKLFADTLAKTNSKRQNDKWTLRDSYTISSEASAFDFVTDVAGDLCGFVNRTDADKTAALRAMALRIFRWSILSFYLLLARTDQRVLAFAHTMTLALTDAIALVRGHSQYGWTPRQVIIKALAARTALSLFPTYWMFSHALVFVVYAPQLISDALHAAIPSFTLAEARALLYHGMAPTDQQPLDIAARPQTLFLALLALNIFLLTIAAFDTKNLPTHLYFDIIPSYACFVLAYASTAAYGSMVTAIRIDSLGASTTLVKTFVLTPLFTLPRALRFIAFIIVAFIGLFFWGATGKAVFFIIFTFGFFFLYTTCYSLRYWITEQHCLSLITWPPAPILDAAPEKEASMTREEVALAMLDSQLGTNTQTDDNKSALANFNFPPLTRTDPDDFAALAAMEIPTLPSIVAVTEVNNTVSQHETKNDDENNRTETSCNNQRRRRIDLGFDQLRERRRTLHPSAPDLGAFDIIRHLLSLAVQRSRKLCGRRKEPRVTADSESTVVDSVTAIPFWEAVLCGCLLYREYIVLFSAIMAPVLLVIMGCSLSVLIQPHVLGHLVWISGLAIAGVLLPIVQMYFAQKCTMQAFFHFGWCFYLLAVVLSLLRIGPSNDMNATQKIIGLNLAFLFPVLYICGIALLSWIDEGKREFIFIHTNFRFCQGNKTMTFCPVLINNQKALYFFGDVRTSQILAKVFALWGSKLYALFSVILALQIGIWGGALRGFVSCILSTAYIWHWLQLYVSARKNTKEHLYLPKIDLICQMCFRITTFATALACIAPLAKEWTLIFATIALVAYVHTVLIECLFQKQVWRHFGHDLWLAPIVAFPVYAYDHERADIVDTTDAFLYLARILAAFAVYGAALSALVSPVALGTSIFFAMAAVAIVIVVHMVSSLPLKLGEAARDLDLDVLLAAEAASEADFYADLEAIDTKMVVRCLDNEASPVSGGDKKDKSSNKSSALAIAKNIEMLEQKSQDGMWSDAEALHEALHGSGPWSFLSCFAYCFGLARPYRVAPSEQIKEEDEILSETDNLSLSQADIALDQRFELELRCCVRFHLRLVRATRSRADTEARHFRDFLNEHRFKLWTSGILPPLRGPKFSKGPVLFDARRDVVPLAVWLATSLSEESKSRFFGLQSKFRQDECARNARICQDIEGRLNRAKEIQKERRLLGRKRARLFLAQQNSRRLTRKDEWIQGHDGFKIDSNWYDEWLVLDSLGAQCIEEEDAEEYNRLRFSYTQEVLLRDLKEDILITIVENRRIHMREIEASERDCCYLKAPDTDGPAAMDSSTGSKTTLRFKDSEFLAHQSSSVGKATGVKCISREWRSADWNLRVFNDLRKPNQAISGYLVRDEWLVDSLSVLRELRPRILTHELFVKSSQSYGDPYASTVGVYGVRLYVPESHYEVLLVDTNLPCLGGPLGHDKSSGVEAIARFENSDNDIADFLEGHDTNEETIDLHSLDVKSQVFSPEREKAYDQCRGFAVARTLPFDELWVSLVEKAISKLFRSYAALEDGDLDDGLSLITGSLTERIDIGPNITTASSTADIFAHDLWSRMLIAKNEECIIAARCIDLTHANTDIREGFGLAWGRGYAVLDLISLQGHKFIQLVPPPQTLKFYGPWHRNDYTRWTPRLRKALSCFPILGDEKDDDGQESFWMSFDDFCAAFCAVYLCHHWDTESKKWQRKTIYGRWTVQGNENTAAGLPSIDNPTCELEKNPQFILTLKKPAWLKLILTQNDARGLPNTTLLPIAAYIFRVVDKDQNSVVPRIKRLDRNLIIAHTGDPRASHQIMLSKGRIRLQPGRYVLLCATYHPKQIGAFTVSILTDDTASNLRIDQLWPPPWRHRATTVNAEPFPVTALAASVEEENHKHENESVHTTTLTQEAKITATGSD